LCRSQRKRDIPFPPAKELKPVAETQIVFRDTAFEDDVAKSNLAAIFGQYGLTNVRSL
jgi:adenine-specific DNA-methyltransferase